MFDQVYLIGGICICHCLCICICPMEGHVVRGLAPSRGRAFLQPAVDPRPPEQPHLPRHTRHHQGLPSLARLHLISPGLPNSLTRPHQASSSPIRPQHIHLRPLQKPVPTPLASPDLDLQQSWSEKEELWVRTSVAVWHYQQLPHTSSTHLCGFHRETLFQTSDHLKLGTQGETISNDTSTCLRICQWQRWHLSVTARQLDSGPVTLLQWEVEWEAREAREEVTKLVGKRRQVNSLTLILIIHSLTLKTLNAPFLWSSALSRETIMKYSNNVQKKVWNGFLILRTSLCAVPCPDVLCHGVGVPWCAMVCHGVPWCAWLCLFSGTTETDRLENETKP